MRSPYCAFQPETQLRLVLAAVLVSLRREQRAGTDHSAVEGAGLTQVL